VSARPISFKNVRFWGNKDQFGANTGVRPYGNIFIGHWGNFSACPLPLPLYENRTFVELEIAAHNAKKTGEKGHS